MLQGRPTLVCFSHLRWEFVWQRPQHLLSRAAQHYQVIFVEEAVRGAVGTPLLKRLSPTPGVTVLQLHVPQDIEQEQVDRLLRLAVNATMPARAHPLILWFYTPMALP